LEALPYPIRKPNEACSNTKIIPKSANIMRPLIFVPWGMSEKYQNIFDTVITAPIPNPRAIP
jgi:hypothetical protein